MKLTSMHVCLCRGCKCGNSAEIADFVTESLNNYAKLTDGVLRKERRFPDDFVFGVTTAAYQIEGGWNADDKGESIWDHLCHNTPEAITDRTNGDIAANSYHNYKRDVEMLRELGLDVYRFSISWPRILPNGFDNYVSDAGVAYYNNLIDELLKYNIQPMVSLYHWDLPHSLQLLGGFLNPHFGNWFEDYARVVFKIFGDKVKYWNTFNEPEQICYDGYGIGKRAPLLKFGKIGEFMCAKNLLLAHARAYRAYDKDFKPTQRGICGFTVVIHAALPLTHSIDDKLAVEMCHEVEFALYTDPIYSQEGDFPKILTNLVKKESSKLGFSRSMLPALTDDERALIRGTYDYFGINHYCGSYISGAASVHPRYSVPFAFHYPDEWAPSASNWLKLMPNSIYIVANTVRQRYGDIPIYITENGWSTHRGLVDDDRVRYHRAALDSTLNALDAGINIKGYMAWSLMDNFEWIPGYTQRFGLYEVDFVHPNRTRTPRKSAFVYKQIVKSRVVDHHYQPKNYRMTIDKGH